MASCENPTWKEFEFDFKLFVHKLMELTWFLDSLTLIYKLKGCFGTGSITFTKKNIEMYLSF